MGCLAERYGADLAESLPEADAVLGFDDYPDIAARLRAILAGETHQAHTPPDRRRLLPITPVERDAPPSRCRPHESRRPTSVPARPRRPAPYAVGSTPARWRRSSWPAAATGAAPSARSRASAARSSAAARARCSRRPLAGRRRASRELFLVSENSTSYGKDLGDLRLLETLLPELAAHRRRRAGAGLLPPARRDPAGADRGDRRHARRRRRTSTSPSSTPAARCCAGCAASATPRASWACSSRSARWPRRPASAPTSSSASPARPRTTSRSCATSSWPRGWTSPASSATPTRTAPRRPASDDKLDEDEVRARVAHVTALVEELTAQRAEERIGEQVDVLVESRRRTATVEGRAAHQGPEVDGTTTLAGAGDVAVGDLVDGRGRRHRGRRPGGASRRGRSRTERRPTEQRRSATGTSPNVLTTLRIVMVPFFGWALLHDGGDSVAVALRGVRAVRRSR